MTAIATPGLDEGRLTRLLIAVALVLAPHALHLPPWITASVAALLAWRWACARRGWSLPGSLVRGVLTVSAFAAVFLTYGRSSGQVAGTALLCLMIGLKLTELQDRRGANVLLLLLYFTPFTHFLRDQAIWTVGWMLMAVLLVTALLIDGQRLEARGWRDDLGTSLRLLLLALPVMLLLWVLFPRVPGPLWGAPIDQATGRTGMSERMSPGDIAQLTRSDEVAFRVTFEGAPPPNDQRYWRGPVLSFTDGREWRLSSVRGARRRGSAPPDIALEGAAVDYELTIEPHRLDYLFALEHAPPRALPGRLDLNGDGAVVAPESIRTRAAYRLRAYPDARLGTELGPRERARALQLPGNANPRARALAEQWARAERRPSAIVARAVDWYRDTPFTYTLRPPALGENSVDAFLFDTRRGFCEHFAGSFATLMRAAGVPARVVLGYQGGAESLVGDYFLVRQSDAHAWVEVWIEGRGWMRVDPTATVAPSRIEQDLDSALGLRGETRAFHWSRSVAVGEWVAARWDFVNMQWNRWVLAYGPDLQRALLSRVGLGNWQHMLIALTVLVAVAMLAVALLSARGTLRMRRRDPLAREWARVCARLARSGLPPHPGEGPGDYTRRVRPVLRGVVQRAFNDAADAYLRARYMATNEAERDALEARLRAARQRLPWLVPGPFLARLMHRLRHRPRARTP